MSQRLFSLGRSTVVCLFTGELIDKKIHNAQPFVNDHVLWGEGGLGGEYIVLHLRLMSSHSTSLVIFIIWIYKEDDSEPMA